MKIDLEAQLIIGFCLAACLIMAAFVYSAQPLSQPAMSALIHSEVVKALSK